MAFVFNNETPNATLDVHVLLAAKAVAETNPFSISQALTDLNTSQSAQVFTQAEFDEVLRHIYAMDIDRSQLTAHEADVLNQIFEHISPAPYLQYCNDTTDPTEADTTLTLEQNFNATAKYAMRVVFEQPFKCSIVSIDVSQTAGTLTPTATPTLNLLGAVDGKNNYLGLWLEYSELPTGTYTYQLTFKDIDGGNVGSTVSKSISI